MITLCITIIHSLIGETTIQFKPSTLRHGVIAQLDVSDLPLLSQDERIKPFLNFSIKTYAKLFRSELGEAWNITFQQVNRFLASLDVNTQTAVAMAMLSMHQRIIEFGHNVKKFHIANELDSIGQILAQLNAETNLCERMKIYALANLPIGDYGSAGQRPQDREDLTFHQNEIEDLLAIVVLCKLMAPVFGVTMGIFTADPELDTDLKETYTSRLLNPIFQQQYPKLIDKLDRYIAHIIQTSFQQDETMVFNGATAASMNVIIRSSIFVRSLVNVDLFYKEGKGNIMTYICSVTKTSISASQLNASHKGSFRHRNPTEFGDGDPNSVSQHEVDSIPSDAMLDTEAIVNAQLTSILGRCLVHHDLDGDMYKRMVEYYDNHPYQLTKLNRSIVFGFFGPHFGGAQTLQLVNAKSFNQLIAFVQLLAFTNSWPVFGHLLTANKSLMAKAAAPSEEEVYLGSNFSSGYEYGNCRQKFLASSSKAWEDGMRGIISELIGAEWIFNTADVIWDAAGEVNRNGSTIIIQRFIAKEVAAFAERFIFV